MKLLRAGTLIFFTSVTVFSTHQQELVSIVRESRISGKEVQNESTAFLRMIHIDGVPYVSLVQAAALLEAKLSWDKQSESYLLSLSGNGVRFFSNSAQAKIHNVRTQLDKPTVKNESGFWVPISFFTSPEFSRTTNVKLVWPVTEPEPEPKKKPERAAKVTSIETVKTPTVTYVLTAKALKRIVIDPGHGGKDPGAIGPKGTMEKDVNLQVALHLADLLREKYGYEVLLTRMDDTFVPLEERSRLANKHNADLFLSLHCNASTSHRLKGFEVYFLSENASDAHADAVARFENAALALEGKNAPSPSRVKQVLRSLEITANINEASVAGALLDQHLANRLSEPSLGVKQAAFYVLRGARMPSVLVEMAFISNKQEERLLQSSSFRKKMVEGLGAGIAAYDLRKQKERS